MRERNTYSERQPIMWRKESSSESVLPEDVRHAYRLLLGREPDPAGYANHVKAAVGRLRPIDFARLIMASDEYRVKQSALEMIPVEMDGYILYVSPSDGDVSTSIRQRHAYEPYVEAVLRKVLRRGDVFVDVGANVGYFTALAAKLVGPDGRVVAWEPLDKNVQLIYAAAWENGFTNVTVYPFAASSDVRMVPMTSSPLSSNAGIRRGEIGSQRTRVIAQTQRLDDQLAHLDRLDVIKFDIEGHESHAWRGAASILARHRPHVLTEFHPQCIRSNTDIQPIDYLQLLFDYAPRVEVLHRNRENVVCSTPDAVMSEWQLADEEFGMDGGMHIDLYINPGSRT
ncbi:MAG: FkbM family methyltransferase [Dokdonella sp.]|nr:MAG: FkbM family methyltransferase [Dokdonella sp.]